jgi:hypothetical protein
MIVQIDHLTLSQILVKSLVYSKSLPNVVFSHNRKIQVVVVVMHMDGIMVFEAFNGYPTLNK